MLNVLGQIAICTGKEKEVYVCDLGTVPFSQIFLVKLNFTL